MNVSKIIDTFRREIKDAVKPYLCSPEDALDFLNQAQIEAARRSRLIVDSTSSICRVDVYQGDPIIAIDPRVISIRRIRLSSSSIPLVKKMVRDMDESYPGWDNSPTPGTPRIVVVDYQSDAGYLYPPPDKSGEAVMTATREPAEPLLDDEDVPEIPPHSHYGLIGWMKFKAYSTEDSELYDAKQAATALSEFESEFGPPSSIANERWDFEHYDDVGER